MKLSDKAKVEIKSYNDDLKEVDGWLSPLGLFYESTFYDHIVLADMLIAESKYEMNLNIDSKLNGELTLEKNGWVKISLNRLVVFQGLCLTKKQLDFLFDYYVANNIQEEYQEIFLKHRVC
ncbi:MAG: hypothetical protein HGA27_00965 [Peptococcaceae bacterium]|nr:hypothetical protein [Peptococcaceae bacterium]